MSTSETFSSSLLLATLPTLSPPHFLSPIIHAATASTNDHLTIVLFSRFFNVGPTTTTTTTTPTRRRRLSYPETQAISHTDHSNWTAVQRLLTFVYVQSTKVAQEQGKILIDIVVLLKGYNEDLVSDTTFVSGVRPEIVFRVSGDCIPTQLPPSIGLARSVYLPPGDTHPDTSTAPSYFHLDTHNHVRVETPFGDDLAYQASALPPSNNPLPGPDTTSTAASASQTHDDTPLNPHLPPFYPVVALGGTFDHLHAGHKILLSMGAWIASRKLIVGVTSPALLQHKPFAGLIQPLELRMQRVREFLGAFKAGIEYEVTEIKDVYGPTGWDPDVQALVVSRETVRGGEMVAAHRASKNLPPLKPFVIDVISSTEESLDHEDAVWLAKMKLSSTFIRGWIAERQANCKSDE